MTIRKLLLAAASIAAIVPAVSHASAESAALQACAQAFATSFASASGTPSFKLKYHSEPAGTLGDYYQSRAYTFYLQARDSKTGTTLGHATCSVDSKGAILALTATPETLPALAAR